MRPERPTLFCPVKMACEVLSPRWTIQILAEMWWGSSRFNELRRGIPGISTSLLTKRLKELQANGLVDRIEDPVSGAVDYIRTPAAVELEPIIQGLGEWAYNEYWLRASQVKCLLCPHTGRSGLGIAPSTDADLALPKVECSTSDANDRFGPIFKTAAGAAAAKSRSLPHSALPPPPSNPLTHMPPERALQHLQFVPQQADLGAHVVFQHVACQKRHTIQHRTCHR
jgi:DNA-binding HxlR family transcriptional regulator